ncbi:lectin-like domain-containing protein [Ligilactobacillus acidipiscis]|uniref:lectin-like domain-containing protein n=1 Tax=Ligilactobacillus acidipiscis TaxID=89059 RepID=UPI0023F6F4CE|nr:MucBP domain-containing protein [Ligilactobacillus acidipiscis]WEV58172.1 MucBP domain-containing protein [Ligilactobacillus acidipiscis]
MSKESNKSLLLALAFTGISSLTMLAAAEIVKVNHPSIKNEIQISNVQASQVKNDNSQLQIIVNSQNLMNYFSLHGAASYSANEGIVTLTPDSQFQVGNLTLNTKIDMNKNFVLEGAVNLGNKNMDNGGADGISFAFHTGSPGEIGQAGANLGLGGLKNVRGFKLDTYHDSAMEPGSTKNTNDPSENYGWEADPNLKEYGAFVNTFEESIGNKTYWWPHVQQGTEKSLNPADLDGKMHPFKIQYTGATNVLTISYTESNEHVLTWKEKVATPEKSMAMMIAAATGANKNLQQFKINQFKYYVDQESPKPIQGKINVHYETEDGIQLATGKAIYPEGPYLGKRYQSTQKEFPGYQFVGMKENSLPPNGELTNNSNGKDVIYVFAKKTAAQINYIDSDTNKVLKRVSFSGLKNHESTYSTNPEIEAYQKDRYHLVRDEFSPNIFFKNNKNSLYIANVYLTRKKSINYSSAHEPYKSWKKAKPTKTPVNVKNGEKDYLLHHHTKNEHVIKEKTLLTPSFILNENQIIKTHSSQHGMKIRRIKHQQT